MKTPADLEWYKAPKRPIAEILADLSKPIPACYLDVLGDKGNCKYIPWFHACSLLDRCCGGHWDYEIKAVNFSSDRIFITARISIYALEGTFSREATGTETLKRVNKKTGEIDPKEHAYGDPSSNAESMALRRAAAKFGLARYLYEG